MSQTVKPKKSDLLNTRGQQPSRTNKQDAKEKLIEAGLALIGERTTITSRGLAQAAQVNHAMINYHFGSLGNFIDTIADRCITELRNLMLPELKRMEHAADTKDKNIARVAIENLLAILSGPQGAKLLTALTQPQPASHSGSYPKVMRTVLQPMHQGFTSLLVAFREVERNSLECGVLGQLMIAECMAFFRGGGVVLANLGQKKFNDEQVLEINQIILFSLCRKIGIE